jgi:hypothetical protein
LRKLFCALVAVSIVCLGAPSHSFAQDVEATEPTSLTGLDELLRLVAALQNVIAALQALGGGGITPVQMPPIPPMTPPEMPPLDMPIEPPPVIIPGPQSVACAIVTQDLVNLGDADFQERGVKTPGIVAGELYPSAKVFAVQSLLPNSGCQFPGMRVRILVPPKMPLEFLDPNPPGVKVLNSIFVTAQDTGRLGGCRVPFSELPAASESGFIECVSSGSIQFIFAEEPPSNPDPAIWTQGTFAARATDVILTINQPTKALLADLLGILWA